MDPTANFTPHRTYFFCQLLNPIADTVNRSGQVQRGDLQSFSNVADPMRYVDGLALGVDEQATWQIERPGVRKKLIEIRIGHGSSATRLYLASPTNVQSCQSRHDSSGLNPSDAQLRSNGHRQIFDLDCADGSADPGPTVAPWRDRWCRIG